MTILKALLLATFMVAFFMPLSLAETPPVPVSLAETTPAPAPVPAPALASPCASRDVVVAFLEGEYGETSYGIGLDRHRNLVELFYNPKTKSWSLLITRGDGVSCLAIGGKDFEIIVPKVAGPNV